MIGEYKGIAVVILREMIWQQGGEAEREILAALSPGAKKCYIEAASRSWIPFAAVSEIMDRAVDMVYANRLEGLRDIGKKQVKLNIRGLYRLFLYLFSTPFLLKVAVKMCPRYFRPGRARLVFPSQKGCAIYIVENYSELPESIREVFGGLLAAMIELSGAKCAEVRFQTNGTACQWSLTWQ